MTSSNFDDFIQKKANEASAAELNPEAIRASKDNAVKSILSLESCC